MDSPSLQSVDAVFNVDAFFVPERPAIAKGFSPTLREVLGERPTIPGERERLWRQKPLFSLPRKSLFLAKHLLSTS
jgi:hypothetical protein